MKSFYFWFIAIYIPLTSVIQTSGSGDLEGNADRLIFADFMALALIAGAAFNFLQTKKIKVDKNYILFIPLCIVFLFSAVFSEKPDKAMIETLAVIFSVIVSISLVNHILAFDHNKIHRLLQIYLISIGLISTFFLLDFFFLHIIDRGLGGLNGTFRNTGQAGAFLGLHFAVGLSLVLSNIVPRKIINYLMLAIIFIALLFTFKRAALIGSFLGIILLLGKFLRSNSKTDKLTGINLLISLFILGTIGSFLFTFGLDNVDSMRWRWESKFNEDSINKFESGFLSENIAATLSAFSDNMLIGVGLGNVNGSYFHHEIHSTYLKIIATSGILGTICYISFMSFILHKFHKFATMKHSQYQKFFYYFLPMFWGLIVSWAYTYHLRKREFWFLIAVTIIIGTLALRNKKQET